MLGFCAVWRYPTPLRRGDLGAVRAEQFHPTVSRLLGIQSAAAATAEPLHLER